MNKPRTTPPRFEDVPPRKDDGSAPGPDRLNRPAKTDHAQTPSDPDVREATKSHGEEIGPVGRPGHRRGKVGAVDTNR